MAARHLGMGVSEWDALPWWQRQMYLEGFEEEELVRYDGDSAADTPESTDLSVAEPGDFAALGFRETNVG